jgi:hypothetical protein
MGCTALRSSMLRSPPMKALACVALLGSVCACSSDASESSGTRGGGQAGTGGGMMSDTGGTGTGTGGTAAGGTGGSATGGAGGTATGGIATGGTGGTAAGGTGGSSAGGGAAGGAHAEFRSCTASTECVVVPETCCGSCGVAARGDAIALRQEHVAHYRQAACEYFPPCLPCADDPDPTLVATCAAGLCEVVDLLEHDVTLCSDPADCRVRAQACCECGADTGPSSLIALRTDAEATYQQLVCPADTFCAECASVYPDEATAVCSGEGRCRVEW